MEANTFVIMPSSDDPSLRGSIAKGTALIASAQDEADSMLAAAKNEAKAIHAKAYDEGYALGRREAEAKMVTDLAREHAVLSSAATHMTTICTFVCKEVLGTELVFQPNSISQRIARGLATIPLASRLRVRVHPQDLQFVKEALPEVMQKRWEPDNAFLITEDVNQRQGSAKVETEYGVLDCDVRVHFAALVGQLHGLCLEVARTVVSQDLEA